MESKKSIAWILVYCELISSFLVLYSLLQIPLVESSVESSPHHCNTQDECGEFMMCLDNECVCDDDTLSTSVSSSGSEELSCGPETCDNITNTCGMHSYCNTEGICKCSDGYEEEKHSHQCKLPFGSQCASTEACNTGKFLSCIHGTCRCHNEEDSAFDPIKQTCVGRLSKSCELHAWMGLQLGCGHNAECSKHPPSYLVNPHDGYGICHCSSGFLPVKSQGAYPYSCEASLGRECKRSRDCGDYANNLNLICLRNKCSCKSGSFFDQKANRCRLLVGSKCKIRDNDERQVCESSCVENAFCKSRLDESSSTFRASESGNEGVCSCADGFTMSSNKTCYPTLSHREMCSSHSNISCDSNLGLVCRENVCECRDNYEYNFEAGKCIAYSCNLNESSSSNDNLMSCPFSNSECNPDLSICECAPGYFQDMKTGKCIKLLGADCSLLSPKSPGQSNIECTLDGQYDRLGMTCLRTNSTYEISGECGCVKEETIFDEEAEECRMKVGERCSSSKRRCVTNSFCGTADKCQCYEGYTTDSERNCLLSFDEPCGMSRSRGKKKKCNSHAGLSCIRGKCGCGERKEFNISSLKCQDLKSLSINSNSSNVDALSHLEYSSNPRVVENPNHVSQETSTNVLGKVDPTVITTSSNTLLIMLILSGSLLGIILATFVGLTLSQKYGKFQLLRPCSTDSRRIHVEHNYVIST